MTDDIQPAKSASEETHQQHFGTDHLLANLKQRTISSGAIRAMAQGIQFALILGYNIILARLLSPQEFGLVAMVMTIIGFLQIFRDMGLSTATIQRADINHAQVSNLFWLNVAVSGTISLLIALGAHAIAWFYHEPKLVSIAWALSGCFLLNGLAVQHVALLDRQMRFIVTSVADLSSLIVGLAVGIGMALTGYSYWSLVGATLVQALFRLVIVWSVSRWRPQLPVRGVGTRTLVVFGANLTVSGFIYSVSRGCDSLLVGRIFGADALGLYTRAAALVSRPMEQLIGPVYSVMVPALSRLQDQPDRYRRFFLQVFEAMAIAGFLFAGLVLPLARPLTLTILGAKWDAAAPIFAGLSIAALFVPLSAAVSWLYTSQGRGRDLMRVSVFGAIVMVVAVCIGLAFGPAGVAIAFSLSGVFLQLPYTFYIAGKGGPVTARDLLRAFLCHLPVFIAAISAAWLVCQSTGELSPGRQLLVSVPAGLLAAVAAIWLSPPSRRASLRLWGAFLGLRKY